MGGVLRGPLAPTVAEAFGAMVVPELLEAWRVPGQAQLIALAELFPILVARATWSALLAGRDNVSLIDNISAKDAIIRGASSHSASLEMAGDVWVADTSLRACAWYERVPSAANPADGPSRGSFHLGLPSAVRVVDPVAPAEWPRDGAW